MFVFISLTFSFFNIIIYNEILTLKSGAIDGKIWKRTFVFVALDGATGLDLGH